MSSQKGFTLVEVIVVAVIVAVLAAVAIPSYTAYVRTARINSAKTSSELIGAAILQTHNRGLDISSSGWNDIGITDPSDENWTYTFPALTGNAAMSVDYTISATGCGPMTGKSGGFRPRKPLSGRWTGDLL